MINPIAIKISMATARTTAVIRAFDQGFSP
jgi:hypothetical protein